MKGRNKTRTLVQFSILLALEAIFCFTPLGSLPALGPIVATLAHIPIILTAILMGPWIGSCMGFFAGIFSLLIWTFLPPVPIVAFVFSPVHSFGSFSGNFGSVLICLVPRILVGTVTGLLYQTLKGKQCANWLQYGLSGFLGSLTNTLGVMGGIWLFFGDGYASATQQVIWVVIGSTIITSGIPEAIVGALVALYVGRPVQKALLHHRPS